MISIIIPVFNTRHEWLNECLDSIAVQTFPDWEAIIVDDASDSPILLSDFPCTIDNPRFRLIRHESNKGPAAARNTAVSCSYGELLFTMDSDDTLVPDSLEIFFAQMKSYPHIDCVYSQFQTFGSASVLWDNPVLKNSDMILKQWVPGPGVLMKRALFDKIGGYPQDEIFRCGNEDWDFWLGAASLNFIVERIPRALYNYRISQKSLSNTSTKRWHYKTIERMYERHKSFIDAYSMADRFLYNGYYSSVRRCSREELARVMHLGYFHAPSMKDKARLYMIFTKRIVANIIDRMRRTTFIISKKGEMAE
ncbi:MAG: glycosyltransferase [Rectinemataceae bacterium]|nr:glycosyltransferase [Rectinemataceae bacterium]